LKKASTLEEADIIVAKQWVQAKVPVVSESWCNTCIEQGFFVDSGMYEYLSPSLVPALPKKPVNPTSLSSTVPSTDGFGKSTDEGYLSQLNEIQHELRNLAASAAERNQTRVKVNHLPSTSVISIQTPPQVARSKNVAVIDLIESPIIPSSIVVSSTKQKTQKLNLVPTIKKSAVVSPKIISDLTQKHAPTGHAETSKKTVVKGTSTPIRRRNPYTDYGSDDSDDGDDDDDDDDDDVFSSSSISLAPQSQAKKSASTETKFSSAPPTRHVPSEPTLLRYDTSTQSLNKSSPQHISTPHQKSHRYSQNGTSFTSTQLSSSHTNIHVQTSTMDSRATPKQEFDSFLTEMLHHPDELNASHSYREQLSSESRKTDEKYITSTPSSEYEEDEEYDHLLEAEEASESFSEGDLNYTYQMKHSCFSSSKSAPSSSSLKYSSKKGAPSIRNSPSSSSKDESSLVKAAKKRSRQPQQQEHIQDEDVDGKASDSEDGRLAPPPSKVRKLREHDHNRLRFPQQYCHHHQQEEHHPTHLHQQHQQPHAHGCSPSHYAYGADPSHIASRLSSYSKMGRVHDERTLMLDSSLKSVRLPATIFIYLAGVKGEEYEYEKRELEQLNVGQAVKLVQDVMAATHVVLQDVPIRTASMLRAIAGGKWILRYSWYTTLMRKKNLQREEDYEYEGWTGAKRSRLVHRARSASLDAGKTPAARPFEHIVFDTRRLSGELELLLADLVEEAGGRTGTRDAILVLPSELYTSANYISPKATWTIEGREFMPLSYILDCIVVWECIPVKRWKVHAYHSTWSSLLTDD
jgi:hypothetical protein